MKLDKRMTLTHYLVWTVLLLGLLAACGGDNTAVPSGSGIPVAPEFAEFYASRGGARVFGAPITEAFPLTDDADSPVVQYFQSMRLDYAATAASAARISIYPLGEWAAGGVQQPTAELVLPDAQTRAFPETGQVIQGAFLTFYENVEGDGLFGPPISPLLQEGERIVQYFRNARLELRPDLPAGQQVQVSLLGQNHFDAEIAFIYQEYVNARPIVADAAAAIREVQVTTGVRSPILYAGETQQLYVQVQQPDGRPVAAVRAALEIVTAAEDNSLPLGETDENGRIQMPLTLHDIPPGEAVRLTITVYNGTDQILGTDTIEFRTWW